MTEEKSIAYYKEVIEVQKKIINSLVDKIARDQVPVEIVSPSYDLDECIINDKVVRLSMDGTAGEFIKVDF